MRPMKNNTAVQSGLGPFTFFGFVSFVGFNAQFRDGRVILGRPSALEPVSCRVRSAVTDQQ
jgi:hypothetical protein